MYKTLLFFSIFQRKKPTEPIYAEPSKLPYGKQNNSGSTNNTPNKTPIHFNEYDGVVLRNNDISPSLSSSDTAGPGKGEPLSTAMRRANFLGVNDNIDGDEKSRHSDTQLLKQYTENAGDHTGGKVAENVAACKKTRKLHSKSFSLTENRIVASIGSNLFQQNRELWEKRAELLSQHSLTTPRILTRNRIAPDLVMDLPFPVNKNEAIHSSRESVNSNDCNENGGGPVDDMTSAERFAAQNQCTLKKNERYSDAGNNHSEAIESKKEVKLDFKICSSHADKPKAAVKPQESSMKKELNDVSNTANDLLRIDEDTSGSPSNASGDSNVAISLTTSKKEKSPIPQRNTKKYVSQFADMHLTGGCLTKGTALSALCDSSSSSTSTSSATSSSQSVLDELALSSFKPHVKVKPQVLRKPIVLPPSTPEMAKRNKD